MKAEIRFHTTHLVREIQQLRKRVDVLESQQNHTEELRTLLLRLQVMDVCLARPGVLITDNACCTLLDAGMLAAGGLSGVQRGDQRVDIDSKGAGGRGSVRSFGAGGCSTQAECCPRIGTRGDDGVLPRDNSERSQLPQASDHSFCHFFRLMRRLKVKK